MDKEEAPVNFMRNDSEAVQSDPLVHGNSGLANRGLQGGWAHLAGVAMVAVATPYWRELPIAGAGLSAVIVAVTLWRLSLILAWRRGREGKHWRTGYEVAIVITAISWGLMLAAATWHFGVERWATTLLITISVGISAGGLTALAPHYRLMCVYLALIWTPAALACLAAAQSDTYAAAVMMCLFLAYVLTQGRMLHSGYWSDWRRAVDLEQAKRAAEAASRAKSEFLANISHEIRTPMHGVLGMLNASLEGEMKPDQRDLVETAKISAESLLSLLNDVLDFSKTGAGQLRLESIAFALPDLVASTVKGFSAQAAAKGITLEFAAGPDVPTDAVGDPTRLRQILSNLIGNAIKFTRSGSVTVSVEALAAQPASALCRFQVRDTGIGIPREKQALVFESFAQADGATTRKFGGTGLGLAICRRLVELMGGEITLDSAPGRGSTFTFTVSLELPLDDKPSPRPAGVASGVAARPGLSILVAEDNPVNQRLAVRLLEKERHSVRIAANGREAVAQWESGSFDAVLMDIQMPDMDGYEATALIRQKEAARGTHTPIIGVTANAIDGDRERCLAAGMDAYLAKPFKAGELYAVIEQHVPAQPA